MQKSYKPMALILFMIIFCGCVPASPPTTITTVTKPFGFTASPNVEIGTSTPLPIGEPAATNTSPTSYAPTSAALTAPISNNFGLVIEENEIRGSIDLDPLNFQPVRGSQQEVMGQHTQTKKPHYIFETNYEKNNFVMHAIARGREFKAIRVERNESGKNQLEVLLEQADTIIFSKKVGIMPFEPLRGLWVDNSGNWVIELVSAVKTVGEKEVQTNPTGQLYQNGELLNQKYGYQEIFGYQLLNSKPFYFYQKDGRIHLSYDNQDLPLIYDEIPHYRCCSGTALNPVAAPNWVGFFGRKNDIWYYTEIGKYGTP